MGELRRREGNLPEAIAAFERAFNDAPSTDAILGLYEAMSASNEANKALKLLEQWVDKHIEDLSVRRTLALGYVASNQLDKARDLQEKLIAENPNDAVMLATLARIYQLQKRKGARDYAERAYRLDPVGASTLDTLGWILATEGEYENALRYLRDSLARNSNALTRYHLAAVLKELGRNDEAKLEAKKLLDSEIPVAWRSDVQKLYESFH